MTNEDIIKAFRHLIRAIIYSNQEHGLNRISTSKDLQNADRELQKVRDLLPEGLLDRLKDQNQ